MTRTRTMKLSQGKTALIDNEDWVRVSCHRWYAQRIGKKWYASTTVGAQKVRLHRLLCALQPGDGRYVDHRNGDSLDNRRENLRVCSNAENARNSRAHCDSSSKFKGVSWTDRERKWVAQICIDYYQRRIGLFDTEEQAARAYDREARKIHKAFAHLNFPEMQYV